MSLRNILYDVSSIGTTMNSLKRIFGQKKNTGGSQSNQTSTNNDINYQGSVEELSLLFETLYDVLTDKGVFTDQEFQAKFDELDMQDGVKDGKLRRD